MDPGLRTPLIDFFRRGEVARDVRLLAAQGALAPRAHEQLALLVLLSDDSEPSVARAAAATLDALPLNPLRAFLARPDVPDEIRRFFAARGVAPADRASDDHTEPLVDTLGELPQVPAGADSEPKALSALSVLERMKLAMKGTREQRVQLVRDPNRLVAAAVLSSPKLSEAEVEAFTRMGNVSEEVLRMIGANRVWIKNYAVVSGLCRHPKTPLAISMQLIHRLTERDVKALGVDRNVQEPLRALARKVITKSKYG